MLLGGTSSEREVSLDSGRNVLAALQRRGVDAHAVDGIPALVQALTDPAGRRFERVFNILHGNRAAARTARCRACSRRSACRTPAGACSARRSRMDKLRTKQVWQSLGLPTPAYASLERGDDVVAAARSSACR